MGLLKVGKPLTWSEAEPYRGKVLESGVTQLIHIFNSVKDRQGDCLKWGDEIEMTIVRADDGERRTVLSLRAREVLEALTREEREALAQAERGETMMRLQHLWRPEYGRYMIEGTPGRPYAGESLAFGVVELNMIARRRFVRDFLKPGERVLTIASFPRLGAGAFTDPAAKPGGPVAESLFVPDTIINEHPRFPFLTRNIRERRGSKVCIRVPVFRDERTGPVDNGGADKDGLASDDEIYMDAMAFGMGMSCLQVTFQGSSIEEARDAYDPLTAISPLFLALTAATPIFRGYLADIDARWSTISGSVDDRTDAERGPGGLPKSRYDSVNHYISASRPDLAERYSDLGAPSNDDVEARLRDAGMDPLLARHFGGLYIRDPLVIFEDRVELDDTKESEHFENIQSTNWQTCRFKPPPPDSTIGWRVEFRPCEVQFSDFENAAFTVFVTLLTRVILSYDLNLYLPLTLVDENMTRAHARDAVHQRKFWARRHIIRRTTVPPGVCCPSNAAPHAGDRDAASDGATDEFVELTLDQIFNGEPGTFTGLIPIITSYLNSIVIDLETRVIVDEYLDLVAGRASGKYKTNATWIRDFVLAHPDYKNDSVVSESINHDLLDTIYKIGEGELDAPELGNLRAVRNILEAVERRGSQSEAYDD